MSRLKLLFGSYSEPNRCSKWLANSKKASKQWQQPLLLETLLQWHQWLFQGQVSLMQKVEPGRLRGAAPMPIVSGPLLTPKVYFQAPPREAVDGELERFLDWFNDNANSDIDPIVRAGITHLWFVTIHPFEDGNGRITLRSPTAPLPRGTKTVFGYSLCPKLS